MKILMSGGGTAGHVYPALSVAEVLAAGRDEVVFVGTPTGLEARLVPEAGVSFVGLPAKGFDRARPTTLVTSSALIASSTLKARSLIKAEKPDVVIGFGGYVSIPVGLAAASAGVPLVLHEQNSVPGMANKFLSRWAAEVGLTYADSARYFRDPKRTLVTGNPVRESVLEADGVRGRARLGVPEGATMLLVFGGSRGARHLNQALVGLRDRLLGIDGVHVVHVTGAAEADTVREALAAAGGDAGGRWQIHEYLDPMGDAMAGADLVVARAGATSIAEITTLGKASVLVPYPYATDDHQTTNAATLVEHEAAVLVADAELDSPRFGDVVFELLGDSERRATMSAASRGLARPDAAERVASMARAAAASKSAPDQR